MTKPAITGLGRAVREFTRCSRTSRHSEDAWNTKDLHPRRGSLMDVLGRQNCREGFSIEIRASIGLAFAATLKKSGYKGLLRAYGGHALPTGIRIVRRTTAEVEWPLIRGSGNWPPRKSWNGC